MRKLFAILTAAVASVASTPGTLWAQGPPPWPPQAPPAASSLKLFTITLVLGDTQAGTTDKLTPPETRALADLKDFLPYKKYSVLDRVPIIGPNAPHIRLAGLKGKHEFFMRGSNLSPKQTSVETLRLWASVPEEDGRLVIKAPPDLLIDTAFKIDVGETVVVGTSRLDGSQALILLVTAVR